MERRERLTFGFKNTQILCGLLMFLFGVLIQSWIFVISFSVGVITNLIFGVIVGWVFSDCEKEFRESKDTVDAVAWGIVLSFPLSLLIIFKNLNLNKIIKWINKI